MELSEIKLIIWDLDDTFWKGTLSEGEITPVTKNVQLVKDLTDRGIINAICSKNDMEPVADKLRELGMSEFFVFNSVDWTPKGPRIAAMIKDMGLRPVNVLFIDDNKVNLNEAKHYSSELTVEESSVIPNLIRQCKSIPAKDTAHKRLKQYQVLEEKQNAKAIAGDNLSFLYSSNTCVKIHNNCLDVADRLFELVHRTNQLNFTKNRSERQDFDALLNDKDAQCGYVTVKDNFGDYGIVGFYALKGGSFIHFLFSCRTIGQGVEQWVYSTLGCPELKIVGEVVNMVEKMPAPEWINQKGVEENLQKKTSQKIVFKGPCDMIGMTSYLISDNISIEMTYGGSKGNFIEHHNHSVNYLQFPFLTKDERKYLVDNFIINDEKMFNTAMYDPDVDVLFLSSFLEPHLGIYRNKTTGKRFAWGHWNRPLTDVNNWEGYLNGTWFTHDNKFTKGDLERFSKEYVYEGRQNASEYIENLKSLFSRLHQDVTICVVLGSELPYVGMVAPVYKNRHIVNKEYNDALREYAKLNPRLLLLDFNDFVNNQSDYTNTISHFTRHVYYEAAQKANEYIERCTGSHIEQKGRWTIYRDIIRGKFYKSSFVNLLRKVYHYFK